MSEDVALSLDALDEHELRVIEKLLQVRDKRIYFATQHHRNTRGERMSFEDNKHLHQIYNSLARNIVLQGSVQSMKAASVNSFVHAPSGWRRMGDLQVGDEVSLPRGGAAKIIQIQPRGVQPLYRFVLDDGRVVDTTLDHRWKVLRGIRRHTLSKGRKSLQWNLGMNPEVLTTRDILDAMAGGFQRFTIPAPTAPVEKPEKSLPLDPYFVGLMLGNGEIGRRNMRFSTPDVELVEAVNRIIACYGLSLKRDGVTPNYFFLGGGKGSGKPEPSGQAKIKNAFESLGLLGTYSHNKFIPTQYKEGSVAQRLAVLQGLLDTDGSACDHGGVVIALSSERMIKDIQEIVWSLGGVAKYIERPSYYIKNGVRVECLPCFTLQITMPSPKSCFRLSRKKAKVSEVHRRKRSIGARIVSAGYVRDEEAQCIVLDDPEHLYLMDNYVVTHNSELVIVDHFAMAACGLAVFFVLAKFEARSAYVQNRIDKCVQMVPEYKRLLGGGFFDNVVLKNFGGGVIKYVGSNVLGDFREFPADCARFDTQVELLDGSTKRICDISVGEQVFGFVGNTKVSDRVTHVVCRGTNDVFEVVLGNSQKLTCTLGEKLYTNRGWKYVYEFLPEECYAFRDDGSVKAVRAKCPSDDSWMYTGGFLSNISRWRSKFSLSALRKAEALLISQVRKASGICDNSPKVSGGVEEFSRSYWDLDFSYCKRLGIIGAGGDCFFNGWVQEGKEEVGNPGSSPHARLGGFSLLVHGRRFFQRWVNLFFNGSLSQERGGVAPSLSKGKGSLCERGSRKSKEKRGAELGVEASSGRYQGVFGEHEALHGPEHGVQVGHECQGACVVPEMSWGQAAKKVRDALFKVWFRTVDRVDSREGEAEAEEVSSQPESPRPPAEETAEEACIDCTHPRVQSTEIERLPKGLLKASCESLGSFFGRVRKNWGPTKVKTSSGEWVAIQGIKYAGVTEVWDITTEKTHTFFANGFAVHNSMVVEEVDDCCQEHVDYGLDRLRASPFQFKRYVGNPVSKGRGINKHFERSTKNEWHVMCPHCNSPVKMDWFNCVVDLKYDSDGQASDFTLMDDGWRMGCGRDIHMIHRECGLPVDRTGEGLWIPANPLSDSEGYWLTMMLSKYNTLKEMFELFQDAWESGTGMAHFYNSCLGLPFTSENSKLTLQMLQRCALRSDPPYRFIIEPNCAHVEGDCDPGPCSMGVDVGKKFDVRISKLVGGQRKAMYVGKVLHREELIELGMRYGVQAAVVDSMPEPRVVEDLQAEAPFYVWSCRYESEGSDKKKKKDRKYRIIGCDRTVEMDRALMKIKSGNNLLPVNFEAILGGSYVKEMTNPVRSEEVDKGGNTKFVWSKCEDHQRHADVYDMLAAQLCEAHTLAGISVG